MIFRKGHICKSLLYFKMGEKPALIMTSCGMISTFFCFLYSISNQQQIILSMLTGAVENNMAVLTCYCGMDDLWSISVVLWVVVFVSFSEEYRTQVIQFVIVNLSLQGNEISVACIFFLFFYLHMSIHFYGRHGLKLQYSARR